VPNSHPCKPCFCTRPLYIAQDFEGIYDPRSADIDQFVIKRTRHKAKEQTDLAVNNRHARQCAMQKGVENSPLTNRSKLVFDPSSQ
jgi:hypothetical protein